MKFNTDTVLGQSLHDLYHLEGETFKDHYRTLFSRGLKRASYALFNETDIQQMPYAHPGKKAMMTRDRFYSSIERRLNHDMVIVHIPLKVPVISSIDAVRLNIAFDLYAASAPTLSLSVQIFRDSPWQELDRETRIDDIRRLLRRFCTDAPW